MGTHGSMTTAILVLGLALVSSLGALAQNVPACITSCASEAALAARCASSADLSCICTSSAFTSAIDQCMDLTCDATDRDSGEGIIQGECAAFTSASITPSVPLSTSSSSSTSAVSTPSESSSSSSSETGTTSTITVATSEPTSISVSTVTGTGTDSTSVSVVTVTLTTAPVSGIQGGNASSTRAPSSSTTTALTRVTLTTQAPLSTTSPTPSFAATVTSTRLVAPPESSTAISSAARLVLADWAEMPRLLAPMVSAYLISIGAFFL